MEAVSLVARAVLEITFLTSGIAKLRNSEATQVAAEALGVPTVLARTAHGLPVVEISLALLLIPGATVRWSALALSALLCGFTWLLATTLARGAHPACQCFGGLSEKPVSWRSIGRNLGLLVATAICVAAPGPGLFKWGEQHLTSHRLPTAVMVLAAVVVVQSIFLLLLATQGPSARTYDAPAAGLPIGRPAPRFSLRDSDGRTVSRSGLQSDGDDLLLVFTSPTCEPCEALMPEVAEWIDSAPEKFRIAVVGGGQRSLNEQKAAEHGVPILLDERNVVARRFRYEGTPGAVLIDGNGRIASAVHSGPDAIRQLVEPAMGMRRTLLPGDRAPRFRLQDLHGNTVTTDDLLGAMTLIVFWDPACIYCQGLLPDLRNISIAHRGNAALDLVVVTQGSSVANRRQRLEGIVLVDDEERSVMHSFGASGTPMAILVDAMGRIASSLAEGTDAVVQLAERAAALTSPVASWENSAATEPIGTAPG